MHAYSFSPGTYHILMFQLRRKLQWNNSNNSNSESESESNNNGKWE